MLFHASGGYSTGQSYRRSYMSNKPHILPSYLFLNVIKSYMVPVVI